MLRDIIGRGSQPAEKQAPRPARAANNPGSREPVNSASAEASRPEGRMQASDVANHQVEKRGPRHAKLQPGTGGRKPRNRDVRRMCNGDSEGSFLAIALPQAQQQAATARQRLLDKLKTLLRADHLVRNSLYLILSSALQAALGFAFWLIVARLFSTEDVGKATSLISATVLIAYLALLGLNLTFVRYLPTAPNRDELITAGLLLVAICGAAIGVIYVLLIPIIAPRLAFIHHSPAMAVGFVLLTAAAAVNLLTDSVFISSRKSSYCMLTDGGACGITKLACCVIVVGTGAYGLFCASAGGFAAAALASLVLMTTALRWRPRLKKPFRTLQPLIRFSGVNYAESLLNMLPNLVVPLVVLDRLGARVAAYYFIAFQLASLLYAVAFAVQEAFLAEGSHADVDFRMLFRRSRRFLVLVCLPACLVLAVLAHWLLLIFGAGYSQHGTDELMMLAVAAIPIAANNWLQTALRLSGRLGAMVGTSAIYAIAICALAWVLAPHGLTALTAAWPIGSGVAATAGGVAFVTGISSARHRRKIRRVTQNTPASSA